MSDPPLFMVDTSDVQPRETADDGIGEVPSHVRCVEFDGPHATSWSCLSPSGNVVFACMGCELPVLLQSTVGRSGSGRGHVEVPHSGSDAPSSPHGMGLGIPERTSDCWVTTTAASPRQIPVLIPDMPPAEMLLPYLRRMDETGWYSNFGPLVTEFEQRIHGFLSGPHGFGAVWVATTSSGTTALELAMGAMQLGPGTRVVIPGFNFPAAVTATRRLGLEPVICDVDAASWLLTPEIARAILPRWDVGLVVPVAAFGKPVDIEAWDRFTAETGIPVLIDAAAAFDGQPIGETTVVAYSLHATKPFGVGEGGLVATRSESFARRVRQLSNFGIVDGVVHHDGGGNAKLSEYHAAVGLAQLARWEHLKSRRRALAARYAEELEGGSDKVQLQSGWGSFLPANLTVKLRRTDNVPRIAAELEAAGVETRCWYSPPLTRHPSFREIPRASPEGDRLVVCDSLCRQTLGLPFHTRMSNEDVAYVCRQLTAVL